jgi:glycosyltransferase involved in cell wall biosynthesis
VRSRPRAKTMRRNAHPPYHRLTGGVKSDEVRVTPNLAPVSAVAAGDTPNRRDSGRTIAAMGRLTPQENFDLLLVAFGRCVSSYSGWSLIILVEGDERRRLETLAGELKIEPGVSSRVAFNTQPPSCGKRTRSCWRFGTRGTWWALPQAMACGLALISTRPPKWIEGDRPRRNGRCIGRGSAWRESWIRGASC